MPAGSRLLQTHKKAQQRGANFYENQRNCCSTWEEAAKGNDSWCYIVGVIGKALFAKAMEALVKLPLESRASAGVTAKRRLRRRAKCASSAAVAVQMVLSD